MPTQSACCMDTSTVASFGGRSRQKEGRTSQKAVLVWQCLSDNVKAFDIIMNAKWMGLAEGAAW